MFARCPAQVFVLLQAILIAITSTAYAKEASFSKALSSEELFYEEMPAVLSATRLRQQLTEIPASVTVIDEAMIRAAGVTDVPELFRFVPGFQ